MTAQQYEGRLAAANRIIAEQNRKLAMAHGALVGMVKHTGGLGVSPAVCAANSAIALIEGRPRFPAAVSSEHPAQAEVTIIMAEG